MMKGIVPGNSLRSWHEHAVHLTFVVSVAMIILLAFSGSLLCGQAFVFGSAEYSCGIGPGWYLGAAFFGFAACYSGYLLYLRRQSLEDEIG